MDLDLLKVDKLFVQSLGTESATSQVASRIIDMAKDMNLLTVAEAVETEDQHHLLKALGVELRPRLLVRSARRAG
jgi:sensor c-di-GMP phosphodiesterase-like protein